MEKLFSEFPPVSKEQWIEQIKKDLKTDDLSKLMRKTLDGLVFEPFYTKGDTDKIPFINNLPGTFPFLRGYKVHNNWLKRHNFYFENIEKTRNEILQQSDRELDIIGISFGKNINLTVDELKKLMDGLKNVAFCAYENLENIYKSLNDLNLEKAFLHFDPFTYYAFCGKFYKDKRQIEDSIIELLSNDNENYKTLGINLHHYANAGATQMQQLAIALALISQYFDLATENKIPPEKILKNIWITIGVNSEFFMEIAKIRAFRYLYSKLVEAFFPEYKTQAITHIHAVTVKRNKTIYDPYVNMLRTSIEAFAAVIANADSLSILPYNAIFEHPTDFSNRIAINQQIILKEEAWAHKYVDPIGGSYYVENLTKSLIENAWNLFLEIENQGGFLKAIENEFIQNKIFEIIQKEKEGVQTGRISILGTNKYPNRTEKIGEKNIKAFAEISDMKENEGSFKTLKIERIATDFEQLRLKTEKSGKNIKVFLLTYGDVAMRRARADFSGNFFAVAGFEIIDNPGFENLDQGIQEAIKSDSQIIVLCSSDDQYLMMSQKCVEKIKDKILVIAGNPATRQEIENLGIKNFIHIKSNIYNELSNFQKMLNI